MNLQEELRCREFELLRAEILSHQHLENNWALFAATGSGTALAFAIERSEPLLCLVVPLIVLASAFRVAAVRYYVWRISAYLMVHFDDRDGLRGSAWERSLLSLRTLRRDRRRASPSAASWMLLFGLLLCGTCACAILVWGRALARSLEAGTPVHILNTDFAAAALSAVVSLVWFIGVRPRFARGLGPDQQMEFVEDWGTVFKQSQPTDEP